MNKRIKKAMSQYSKGLKMMSLASNTLKNGGMIFQTGGNIQREGNVNNMMSNLQQINRSFLPNQILNPQVNQIQSVLQERPSMYKTGGHVNVASAYFGANANNINYRNSPIHAYNINRSSTTPSWPIYQMGGQTAVSPGLIEETSNKAQGSFEERVNARKAYWNPKKLKNLVAIYKNHPVSQAIWSRYENKDPKTIEMGLDHQIDRHYNDIMNDENLWLEAYNNNKGPKTNTGFFVPLKESTSGQKLQQSKQYQMGGGMPQQEEQFQDESGAYGQQLAGMSQGQENVPQGAPEGQEQQLSEQEMMQLAQLIMQGDEEALKLAEQLGPEEQQMLMQIIQQMQQQGQGQEAQMAPQGPPQGGQPSEEEMMMQQQAMQGQEMPMMMVGGMKKKKRKPVTKSSYYSHGGAMKKGVNKSLYQMLGIPC
jgi:hypothetical protein